jgi:hypothetical protein
MALALEQKEAPSEIPLWQQCRLVPTSEPDGTVYTGKIFQAEDHVGHFTGGIEIEITELHIPGVATPEYFVFLYGFGKNPSEIYIPFLKAPKSVDDALSKAASYAYLNLLR